jgi:hypothetical protein
MAGRLGMTSSQSSDFVRAERTVFEDDFRGAGVGKFPARWKLVAGHASIDTLNGETVFALTEGHYVRVAPLVKVGTGDSYLTDSFTVELDSYPKQGSFGGVIMFLSAGDDERQIAFGSIVTTNGFEHDRSGTNPNTAGGYLDEWHHVALLFKNGQLKCYTDNLLMLVVPDVAGFRPRTVSFGGIGRPESPIIIKNVRIGVDVSR